MFKPSILTALFGVCCVTSACVVTSTNDDSGTTATASATAATADPTQGETGQTSDPTSVGMDDTTGGPITPDDDTTDGTTAVDETGGTGAGASCGWGPTGDPVVPEGYVCGGEAEDPDGRFDLACPEDLVEGGPCGELTGVGCCDDDGNVWYCWEQDEQQMLVMETC